MCILHDGKAAQYALGDPLPLDTDVLPTVKAVAEEYRKLASKKAVAAKKAKWAGVHGGVARSWATLFLFGPKTQPATTEMPGLGIFVLPRCYPSLICSPG